MVRDVRHLDMTCEFLKKYNRKQPRPVADTHRNSHGSMWTLCTHGSGLPFRRFVYLSPKKYDVKLVCSWAIFSGTDEFLILVLKLRLIQYRFELNNSYTLLCSCGEFQYIGQKRSIHVQLTGLYRRGTRQLKDFHTRLYKTCRWDLAEDPSLHPDVLTSVV